MVCTSISSQDREVAIVNSLFPAINADDWVRGAANPAVTIVEYSDFQCPYCAQLEPVLGQLMEKYPDQLQIVYRHFPLAGTPEEPIHEKAVISAAASEAAGNQDAFWDFHDYLFTNQATWTELSEVDYLNYLADAAAELGLDVAQFTADLNSDELQNAAAAAWDDGLELGMPGTPYLLIDGFDYTGPRDFASLDTIIQLELLRERQFTECPPYTLEEGVDYTATIHTEKGDIVLALLPEVAPMAVNSFVFLAEHDWFDNVTFHRVLPGFVAQAGDPTGTGFSGPGYAFAVETNENYVFDQAGLLAMANSGPTSNGSQFFITLVPAEHLNGGYTIFGEVLQGQDVVESLTTRDPQNDPLAPAGDLILDVSIEVN